MACPNCGAYQQAAVLERVRRELPLLLAKIEEDAAVDFLGTGSNSRHAEKEEAAWRSLFGQALALLESEGSDD